MTREDNLKELTEREDNPHISPQHRQYLSMQGVGYGTPSQRRKQYDSWRADKASERVFQFRKDGMLRDPDSKEVVRKEDESGFTRKIRTSNFLLRLADDMIKESMAKGDFDNLPGKGQPLKSSSDHNPYVDSHTHKLNNVLINNGYAPQWMTLETEIRTTYQKLSSNLELSHAALCTGDSRKLWSLEVVKFRDAIKELNKKVDTLNMLAPSLAIQMVHYNAELAISKVTQRSTSSTERHDGNTDFTKTSNST
ncbi:DNAJC28 [Bugula neritina]|uniref:DNAJC28 n=1 Tax=Bugula neritina TaxID=10212 RepID=A0A7J7JE31_BUGNE|nr:DNAJC28 [Bugula neritina]